jgi:hypothetical protein
MGMTCETLLEIFGDNSRRQAGGAKTVNYSKPAKDRKKRRGGISDRCAVVNGKTVRDEIE